MFQSQILNVANPYVCTFLQNITQNCLGKSSLSNQGNCALITSKTSKALSVLASGLSLGSQRADHRQAGNIPTPGQRTITSQAMHCTQLLPGPGSQQRGVQNLRTPVCSSELLKIHTVINGHVASHSFIFCLESEFR